MHYNCNAAQQCPCLVIGQSAPSFKKVSFNEKVRVNPIHEKSSEMTPEEKARIYYSKDDMKRFQYEGMGICKAAVNKARSLAHCDQSISLSDHFSSVIKSNPAFRGLEGFACPTRSSNRSIINKVTRAYNKQLIVSAMPLRVREVVLAETYAKLSCRSQMLAILTAQNDRTQVKGEIQRSVWAESTNPMSSTSSKPFKSIPNIVSAVVENKRKLDLVEEQHREKRCRYL